jgi:hypothetical protein
MKAVIAELGMAGYGQACVMLEILARENKNDGGYIFQLPLVRPTDLKFWAREFISSTQETERTFDVFEQADLIMPWRDSQIICAPLLGTRVDEWTRNKRNKRGKNLEAAKNPEPPQNKDKHKDGNENQYQHQHKYSSGALTRNSGVTQESLPGVDSVDVVEPNPLSAGKDVQKEKDAINRAFQQDSVLLASSKIIAEYQKEAENASVNFDATSAHRKLGIEFYNSVGQQLAILSWACWLSEGDHLVQVVRNGKTVKECQAYPLLDFIEKGEAHLWVERIKPYLDLGISDASVISFFHKYFDVQSVAEANLTPADIAVLQQSPLELDYRRAEVDDIRGFLDLLHRKETESVNALSG